MKIELPREITRKEASKLFNMLFGVVPVFSLVGKELTIEKPTQQMDLDVQAIVDVLRREMGLPVVDEEALRLAALRARVRRLGSSGVVAAADLRDAVRALAELMGVKL